MPMINATDILKTAREWNYIGLEEDIWAENQSIH